jgi:hypothetical protein
VTVGTVGLQVAEDGTVQPPRQVYYRERSVYQHCAGTPQATLHNTSAKDGSVVVGNAYVLRRANENQPLEISAKQDLNGDGVVDTDVVFDGAVSASDYSGVWRRIDVAVPASYVLGALRAESQMFEREGSLLRSKSTVVDYEDTGTFVNRPIRGVR